MDIRGLAGAFEAGVGSTWLLLKGPQSLGRQPRCMPGQTARVNKTSWAGRSRPAPPSTHQPVLPEPTLLKNVGPALPLSKAPLAEPDTFTSSKLIVPRPPPSSTSMP